MYWKTYQIINSQNKIEKLKINNILLLKDFIFYL